MCQSYAAFRAEMENMFGDSPLLLCVVRVLQWLCFVPVFHYLRLSTTVHSYYLFGLATWHVGS